MSDVEPTSDGQMPKSLGIFRAVRTRNLVSIDRQEQEFSTVSEISEDVPVIWVQFGDGIWMVVEPADLRWFDG